MKKSTVAIGAALTATLAASPVTADANPFGLTDLAGGYMLAGAAATNPTERADDRSKEDAEGKCGEGKCGEGKCGEGKCGGHDDADADEKAGSEGRCGEGRCGAA